MFLNWFEPFLSMGAVIPLEKELPPALFFVSLLERGMSSFCGDLLTVPGMISFSPG